MGQGASTEVTQQSQKNGSKEVSEKGSEEDIKDVDKTGSLRKKAWLKRKPSDQKSPKSKKKGKENKKKGSQDKLSITTEEPEKEEVSHRLSRIELHLEECQPAPDDDTISLSSCGENIENHLQDVISDESSTAADNSSNVCIANNLTDSISKDDNELLNNTTGLPLSNETHESLNEIQDLKEMKDDLNETDNQNDKQEESIEKQVESSEKQSDLIEKQNGLNEKHDDIKDVHEDLTEKKDDVKEVQEDLSEKKDELKEVQEELSLKKEVQEDLSEKKEVQEDLREKKEVQEELSLKKEVQEDLSEKKEVQEELSEKKEVQEDLSEKKEVQEDLSGEKKDDLEEVQEELSEKKEVQEELSEKKEVQEELSEKKEVQKELSEKKDDLKEVQEDLNEKEDDTNENIVTSTVEVTEVCQEIKEDGEHLLTEHLEKDIPVDLSEENDPKICVSLCENDVGKLPDTEIERETVVSTAGVAVLADDHQDVIEEVNLTTSPQTNIDIITDTQVTSTNLEDVKSDENKDETENSSLSLNISSPLDESREVEAEMKDPVKENLVEDTDNDYATDQIVTELKSEPEVLPSNLSQTEMGENINENSEEILLNKDMKTLYTLKEDESQCEDHEITQQAQIPSDDVLLDSKTSSLEKDDGINETSDCFNDNMNNTSLLSESETICIVKSKPQDLSNEIHPDKVELQEDSAKLKDAIPITEALAPDILVGDSLNHSECSEDATIEEPDYKINLYERNMSDPDILLETIRMMEEAKAKGPSVEIMTTDLDAEDLLDEALLHPTNSTEENKVTNIEINTDFISLQNSNVEEGSTGEPSDQSLAMSSTSTEQSDSIAKMKPAYIDNSNGTVFV